MTLQNGGYSADLARLLTSMADFEQSCEKSSYLFQEGTIANKVYIIHSGKISIGKSTLDGREITFRVCSGGDIISELPLFREPSAHTTYAKVLESGVYSVIPKAELEEKLLRHSDLCVEFLKMMSLQQQVMQSKYRDLVLFGKKGALYSTLIRLTNSYGVQQDDGVLIEVSLTNQELANFCGMSREVVNRLLNQLKREQKIGYVSGKLVIHDLEYLKTEIHCENCPIEICNIFL